VADDRKKRVQGDFDVEHTIPTAARREAPRIATPLAPDLKPSAATPSAGAASGSGVPVPAPTERSSRSAVPAPAPTERSSRSPAPTAAPAERSSRSTVQGTPAADRPPRHPATVPREGYVAGSGSGSAPNANALAPALPAPATDSEPPSVAQQAAYAAALLAKGLSLDTVVSTRSTVASADPTSSSQRVRVHQLAAPEPIDPRLFMLRAPDSPAAAAFRVLRHRLAERAARVLVVTSAVRGEGKSLCALNLALALGEAGRARVLLIEANFRRPVLATLLGFRPPVCFSEQLDAHHTYPMQPWSVVENVTPTLHTMAMAPDVAARPFVDGPALTQCLEQLREASYDYILLDCAAVLGAADVNLVADAVDGVLLTTWAGRSRARDLRAAVTQLGSEKLVGVAVLGTVS
jgi:Mrp family chromosome partitioning ATPase